MELSMTRTEREAFLAGVRVAVISVADPGKGPLTLPVWYRYEPGGDIFFVTGSRSTKADLIRRAGRLSLCVQTETLPYQYVSVEGPVTLVESDLDDERRQIAYRYLGEEVGEMYLQRTAAERAATPSVLIRIKPERWITVDYHKMAL